jgi:condensin complex subunit 2
MDRIIRDESAKGVNFQKASCTIDASIKIYSHRVDDVWSSSYRILENLNRNDGNHQHVEHAYDDDDDNDASLQDQTSSPSRPAKKLKKKVISSTIEKNIANLNLSASEMAGASTQADPMFHKMSQVFDEGGAKGMLLTNLVLIFSFAFNISLSVFLLHPQH